MTHRLGQRPIKRHAVLPLDGKQSIDCAFPITRTASGHFCIQRQQDLGVAPGQTCRLSEILFGLDMIFLLARHDARNFPTLEVSGTVGGCSVRALAGHDQHGPSGGPAFSKGEDSAHGVIFPKDGFGWKRCSMSVQHSDGFWVSSGFAKEPSVDGGNLGVFRSFADQPAGHGECFLIVACFDGRSQPLHITFAGSDPGQQWIQVHVG